MGRKMGQKGYTALVGSTGAACCIGGEQLALHLHGPGRYIIGGMAAMIAMFVFFLPVQYLLLRNYPRLDRQGTPFDQALSATTIKGMVVGGIAATIAWCAGSLLERF